MWLYEKLAAKEALRWKLTPKSTSRRRFSYLAVHTAWHSWPSRMHLCVWSRRFGYDGRDKAGGTHFVRWYVERGRVWLQRRVNVLAPRVGVTPSGLIS